MICIYDISRGNGAFSQIYLDFDDVQSGQDRGMRGLSQNPGPEALPNFRRATTTTAASSYSANPFKAMRRNEEKGMYIYTSAFISFLIFVVK